jgi:lipopolysaccharide/colanic/teichoic acid biosynthesis glycosyltransferase
MNIKEKTLKNEENMLNKKDILRPKKVYWFFRRLQDIVLTVLALSLIWPIMAIIALVIYIDDPKGSPVFTQIRVGRNGKEFKFYKFRTMVIGAEDMLDDLMNQNEVEGPAFKIKEDTRMTKVGSFLRKTGLDELMQLFNILKGDMSLIGPRPPLPREVAQYNEYQMQRLYITPGITCYWQIQPNRNDITFDEWVDLDIKYIKERSFITDWKIIFATIISVFRMDGE